jgi:hypothetical protein
MKTIATSLLVAASIAVIMTGCNPTEEEAPTGEQATIDHAADEHSTPAPAKKAGKPMDHPAH